MLSIVGSNMKCDTISPQRLQRGAVTIFTAILILILMTLLLFYAARVGIFEQRISANDANQKLALHAAEAGIAHSTEYFFGNSMLVTSNKENVVGTIDGWFHDDNRRWWLCDSSKYSTVPTGYPSFDLSSDLDHPCRGESKTARRADSYFYYYNDGSGGDYYAIDLPTDDLLSVGQAVSVRATLCILRFTEAGDEVGDVGGSVCDPSTDAAGTKFMVTFLARGRSDCERDASGNIVDCLGESLVTEPVTNFSALNGPPPNVPLTTRATFPPGGTAEIVANPNGGGVGVPLSVWASDNVGYCAAQGLEGGTTSSLCNGAAWSTCQFQEWYEVDEMPDDMKCPTSQCECSNAQGETMSFIEPNVINALLNDDSLTDADIKAACKDLLGIDVHWASDFPCDLFSYYFGVPKSQYQLIKSSSEILTDCSSLDANSSGLIWIDGALCDLPSTIGSLDDPVMLISAADVTKADGNGEVFGVMFVTDVEKPQAYLTWAGNYTWFGAVVVDAEVKQFRGTMKLVYNQTSASRAHGAGNLGALMGGWTDFPKCWHRNLGGNDVAECQL